MGEELDLKLIPVTCPPLSQEMTPDQILRGPVVEPEDIIAKYSEDKFVRFIDEWAFLVLQKSKKEYVEVQRIDGAGDKGRDVVGYVTISPLVCDYYQCKRYKDPLTPSDIWPELAKLMVFTQSGKIPTPRRFRFVASHGAGPEALRLFDSPSEMKMLLIKEWLETKKERPLQRRVHASKTIPLDGDLKRHVEEFDFSIVRCKPMREIIDEYESTNRYALRFGGGLRKPLPPDLIPPEAVAPFETRYVEQLVDAYREDMTQPSLSINDLADHPKYHSHFSRSRQRFFCAETIREWAKDSLPENVTYDGLRDQVHDAVVDTAEKQYNSGFDRCVATTEQAARVHVPSHPLWSFVKPASLMGMCHQLSNEDRLKWVQ